MNLPSFVYVFAFASAVLLGSAVDAAPPLDQPARFEAGAAAPPPSGPTWGPAIIVGTISSSQAATGVPVSNASGGDLAVFVCTQGNGPPPTIPAASGNGCYPVVVQAGCGVGVGRAGSYAATDLTCYRLHNGQGVTVLWAGTRTTPPMTIYVRTVSP